MDNLREAGTRSEHTQASLLVPDHRLAGLIKLLDLVCAFSFGSALAEFSNRQASCSVPGSRSATRRATRADDQFEPSVDCFSWATKVSRASKKRLFVKEALIGLEAQKRDFSASKADGTEQNRTKSKRTEPNK